MTKLLAFAGLMLIENVVWYTAFHNFFFFLISDVLCDDKEIMADPIRGQKLFQQKKNLFHNISLSK